MSREYPCIHFEKDGMCRKFSDNTAFSYCVMGPCPEQKLSNADRIRSMSDEELAKWMLSPGICIRDFADVKCDGVSCKECRIDWLRQPAEED